jgi:hypothetical protein
MMKQKSERPYATRLSLVTAEAREVGISQYHARRLIEEGQLATIKLGRSDYCAPGALKALVEGKLKMKLD